MFRDRLERHIQNIQHVKQMITNLEKTKKDLQEITKSLAELKLEKKHTSVVDHERKEQYVSV